MVGTEEWVAVANSEACQVVVNDGRVWLKAKQLRAMVWCTHTKRGWAKRSGWTKC